MMKSNTDRLRITVTSFRAIEHADIALNGITVLSGTNGTGKSTISRLLYEIIDGANNFDDILLKRLNRRLDKYYVILESIAYSIDNMLSTNSNTPLRTRIRAFPLNSFDDCENLERTVSSLCDTILQYYGEDSPVRNSRTNRLINILRYSLELPNASMGECLYQLKYSIHTEIQRGIEDSQKRPTNVLNSSIKDLFGENVLSSVSIYEFNDCIFGTKSQSSIPPPHITSVFYINTPFILGANNHHNHVTKLNDALKNPKDDITSEIANEISNKIVNGRARYDMEGVTPGFRFLTNSKEEYDLEDCATGIKAFSIIQMLINSGYVKENTLFVLDEPEAHLHPQWIIEYAKLIVTMSRIMKVYFLISTHSTDMVMALRYISEAQNTTQFLQYYCASPSKSNPNKFVFQPLGLNIEPIFNSFNKSFERLEEYGSSINEEY